MTPQRFAGILRTVAGSLRAPSAPFFVGLVSLCIGLNMLAPYLPYIVVRVALIIVAVIGVLRRPRPEV